MDTVTLLLLFAAGCLSGFLAGFFGVGGGIVLVPILLAIFSQLVGVSDRVVMHLTLGTSLMIVFFTSLSSAYQHYRNGHVDRISALLIGLASVVAAFGGAAFAASLSGGTLQRIFACVLLTAAMRFFVAPEGRPAEGSVARPAGGLIMTGALSGLVSSLAGVGGGIFSIPLMCYLLKFPLKKAIGTSSAAIVLTSAAATLGYVINGWGNPDLAPYPTTLGYVDYLHSVPVILGTLPTARLGAMAVHKVRSEILGKLFAILLLAVAIRLFFG